MDPDQQAHVVGSISNAEVRSLIDNLFLDDTVDVLEEMPANVVTKVLQNTNEATRKLINQFLNYPENSAGSIMTIEFIQFRLGWGRLGPSRDGLPSCQCDGQRNDLDLLCHKRTKKASGASSSCAN